MENNRVNELMVFAKSDLASFNIAVIANEMSISAETAKRLYKMWLNDSYGSSLLDSKEQMEDYLNKMGIRICSHCGKEMTEGFCINQGLEYYCDEKCLVSGGHKIPARADDYCYWTEWEDETVEKEVK